MRAYKFKLHIDNLDNRNKDVWAVQYRGEYYTAKSVTVLVPMNTMFRSGKKQPRAWLEGRGILRWVGAHAFITAV